MKKHFFIAVIMTIFLCSIWAQDARLCPTVIQTEGQGNGGNFLYLSHATRDAIMAGAPWKVQNVEYLSGFSPISVRITNPYQLHPEYDYRLKINPVADAYDNSLISQDAHWTLEVLSNNTVVETYQSIHTIGEGEEEVIAGHGIAITVKNHPYSIHDGLLQDIAQYPNVSYVNNAKFAQVDLLGSYIHYQNGNHYWLSGIKDKDSDSKNNWIRAGHHTMGYWEQWWNLQDGVEDEYAKWSKEDYHYLYPYVVNDYGTHSYTYYYRAFRDYHAQFENMTNGTWCPYPVASAYKGGPQAKYITPDTNLTQEPQPAYYDFDLSFAKYSPGYNPTMINLYSVDLVLTPDQNKWTRAIVLEACEDNALSIGHALRHEPRKSPSVDKNGNPDGTGYGMGWFPGYAINVETGERLNIMFSENSSDIANNGADMIFNPTSDTAHWGGCHFVYICGSSGSTCGMIYRDEEMQRNYNDNDQLRTGAGNMNGNAHITYNHGGIIRSYLNGDSPVLNPDGGVFNYYDCGSYDECKWLNAKFSSFVNDTSLNRPLREALKMQLFNNVMWTSIAMPAQGEESYWLSDEATVYLRVSRPFMFYTSAVGTGPDNPLNNNAPTFVFNTREYANAAPQVLYQIENTDKENTIDINNISAIVSAGSKQFRGTQEYYSDEYATTSYRVPKNTKLSTVFAHAFWMGGLDENNQLHLAATRFEQSGKDFWPGPLSTIDASIDTETKIKWDKCFKITRSEVIDFLANRNTPGYEIPKHIAEWPAHGDVSKGQAYNLAPFIDVDGDYHYDPSHGDYPSFPGDMALFFIFNDKYANHTETGGNPIGLEVHGMVYGFDTPEDTALYNTIFFNYKLFNRSQTTLHDAYIGIWMDWDIGYSHDDYLCCDVPRGTVYAYNGNTVDGENTSYPYAYGANPPAQALTVLGGPKLLADGIDNSAFLINECPLVGTAANHTFCNQFLNSINPNDQYAINGTNFGNGIVDDERLGMTGFLFHNNDETSRGAPRTANEYYQMMKNMWRDGQHMTYGSMGHPDFGGIVGPECRFMFPGTTDPCNWGIIDSIQRDVFNYQDYGGSRGWVEETVFHNQPSDRIGVLNIGPFDFEAGGFATGGMVELDYCMTTAFGTMGPWSSVENCKIATDHIKQLFEEGYITDHFTAPLTIETTATICEGESYNFFGTSYTEPGTYQHHVSTYMPTDIDTCYLLHLNVISTSILVYEAVLPGTAYNENGFSIPASSTTTTGVQIHRTIMTTPEGCPMIVTLVLDVQNNVSINNAIRQQNLTLYPNPTTDFVQFDIQDQNLLNSQEFVMVFDLSGRLLQSVKPTSETVRINLSEYPSGTYIVKLANYIGKIVKR